MPSECRDLGSRAGYVEPAAVGSRPVQLRTDALLITVEFRQLVEEPAGGYGFDALGHGLLGDPARLRIASGATVRVRQVRVGERVGRIPADRFLSLGNGTVVVAQPDQQQRERIRRPVIAGVRALPDLQHFAGPVLIAGEPVVVLVRDEEAFALAHMLALLVGEPGELFAAAGLAEPSVDGG